MTEERLESDLLPVTAFADGSVYPNPGGPGGWGVVLQEGGKTTALRGGSPSTTNNRMELQAVIEVLRALSEPRLVRLYTDSEVTQRCIVGAYRRAANQDLWLEYERVAAGHDVIAIHCKGHRDPWKVSEGDRPIAWMNQQADDQAARGRREAAEGLRVMFHRGRQVAACACGRLEDACAFAEREDRFCGPCSCGVLHVGRGISDLRLGGARIVRL